MIQKRNIIQLFKERVGRNIRMIRQNSGITGEEFAKKLGISRSHLHRLEYAKAYGIVFTAMYNLGKEVVDLDRLFREDMEAIITARNQEEFYTRREDKQWTI